MSLRRRVAALALVPLLAGCAADTWGGARLRDVSDILDVRYGTGLGLGVQVDATMFLGTGLGGSGIDSSRVWYGRHAVDVAHAVFVGLGIGSAFGTGGSCFDDNAARGRLGAGDG